MLTYHPCVTQGGVFRIGILEGSVYSVDWPGSFDESSVLYDCIPDIIKRLSTDLDLYFQGNYIDWQTYPLITDRGTDFQRGVWRILQSIPYGNTITYSDVAQRMGTKAVRAVGSACGRNLIPILIPCHRVINKNGGYGGYSAGLDKKIFLLRCEHCAV